MPVQCTCNTCGKSLVRSPSKVEPRNYCSRTCKYPLRVECACFVCGKPLSRQPSSIKRRTYCSTECSAARWPAHPIKLSEDGASAQIPLHARDGSLKAYATIDAADLAFVQQWRWSITAAGYPWRTVQVNGTRTSVYLHRALFGLTTDDRVEVDHINRNRLDARRANLRIADRVTNAQNGGGWKQATSRYRGVCWDKRRQVWVAQVMVNRQHVFRADFEREEDAAEAARIARLQWMPGATD